MAAILLPYVLRITKNTESVRLVTISDWCDWFSLSVKKLLSGVVGLLGVEVFCYGDPAKLTEWEVTVWVSLIVSVGLLKRFFLEYVSCWFNWSRCRHGKSFIDPIADRDAFGWVEPWRCEASKFCILLRKYL